MTAKQIRDSIMSFTNDVLLEYPGHDTIFINPWSIKRFDLSYMDIDKTYDSIDALMFDPIYDGKTLTEIAEKIAEL